MYLSRARTTRRMHLQSSIEMSKWSVVMIIITFNYSLMPAASTSSAAYSPKDVERDYCEGEKFRPSCSHDEVISMSKAVYGRMKLGRCIKLDMGHLGCKDDVLDLADDMCSGRRNCEILIPDQTFESTKPCLELKSYLQASYTCIKVLTVDSVDCAKPLRARLPSGRIASITTNESRCVSTYDTTWLIHGLPGQRVNISLLDFKVASAHRRRTDSQHNQASNDVDVTCHKYATIMETSDNLSKSSSEDDELQQQPYLVVGRNNQQQYADDDAKLSHVSVRSAVVCGRRARWQHVYTSTSHIVEIQLDWRRANPDYFVIYYNVFGCPNPQLPSTMWFQRRSDNEATVGCRLSADNWRMTCGPGNEWIGNIGNCSNFETVELAVRSTSLETANSAGLLTVVLCVCAFVIALLVIVIGVILHRRHRRRSNSNRNCSSSKSGMYDVTMRGHVTTKSEYGGIPEDYDDDQGVVGDVAYVYPSTCRGEDGGGSSTRHQRVSAGSESLCASEIYDVVDGGVNKSNKPTDGPYEKVSSCRYVHIWEMPLPKAPDEL